MASASVGRPHTGGTTGYASITVERGTVRYSLTLPAAALPSDLADALRLAREGRARSREQLLDVLRTRIVLHAGSTRCEPGPGSVQPAPFDAPTVTISVDFACGGPVKELTVRDDIFDALGPVAQVCSRHAQAVGRVAPGFRTVATAPDGVVEAIEAEDRAVLGVEWHPEADATGAAIYGWLVRRAQERS